MKMDKTYFEEKIELSCESLNNASSYLQESNNLIKLTHYDMPNIVSSNQVRDALKTAAAQINAATIYFENARWASASTTLEFDDWLKNQN